MGVDISHECTLLSFISGLTIFGSMLLLLLILVEAAPPTASAAPLLGEYPY